VLYLVCIAYVGVFRGPFHLAFQMDPEYQYLFYGLELADFYIPSNFQHPGTPVAMLMSVVITVGWFFSGILTGFTSKGIFVVEHHIGLLYAGSAVVAFAIGALLYIIGRQIYKLTGSILPGIALQLCPFASWLLFAHTQRVSPEGLEPLLALLMLWALAPATFGNSSFVVAFPPWRAFLLGVLAAACPATKYMFIAPVGLLILVPRWRNKVWSAAGLAAGCTVMLAMPVYQLLSQRTDFVGVMAAEAPENTLDKLIALVWLDWSVTGLAVTGLLALLLSGWWAARAKTDGQRRFWLITAVAVLGLIGQAMVVSTRLRPHYYVAALAMGLFLAPHLAELIRRAIPWRVPAMLIVAILILLLPLSPHASLRVLPHFGENSSKITARYREVDAKLDQMNSCRVAAFYSSSYPLFALSFGNDFSQMRFADELETVYPGVHFYDPFRATFLDWHHQERNPENEEFAAAGGCILLQVGHHLRHRLPGWQVREILPPMDGSPIHDGLYQLSIDPASPVLYERPPRAADMIEAEDFAEGNVIVRELGESGVITSETLPAYAEYRITRYEGRYGIRIRYAAADARPVSLRINGELVFGSACLLPTGGDGADSLKWHDIGIYPLVEGENVLRLESDSPFPLIDQIHLRQVGGY
jgi:hypothetical protein